LKVIGFLVLLAALVVGGYGYFFDHSLLRQIGLGSLVADDAASKTAAPPSAGPDPYGGGLVKCVDSKGRITFSNQACPDGQTAHAVTLSTKLPSSAQAATRDSKTVSQDGQTVTTNPGGQP